MSDTAAKEKRVLFAGTFDPFTKGHHRIVERALEMFGTVVVAVGRNAGKLAMLTPQERVEAIERIYATNERVEVIAYDGLTLDCAQSVGASALLRGVRSVKDFEYERDLADLNLRIGGIDTVLLVSEPEYAAVSSSVVRELLSYGKDVSAFMPDDTI